MFTLIYDESFEILTSSPVAFLKNGNTLLKTLLECGDKNGKN